MTAVDVPPRQHQFTVASEAASVPWARREAAKVLANWGLDRGMAVVDTALVVLSELVTNCVRHASVTSPHADITLSISDAHLVVAVHDRHPYRPTPLTTPHRDGSGGWGLLVVQRLTAEAGGGVVVPADADRGGKTITVRLPLP
jgi:two-component sensor histidine kinase